MSHGQSVEAERRLRAEIVGLLEEAEAGDAAEDAYYGKDARGDDGSKPHKREYGEPE